MRRAEPPEVWRVMPLIHPDTTRLRRRPAAAMDTGASMHDVFSSDRLWEQSSFFDLAELQDSSLFAPLQLDSEPSRLPYTHLDAPC